MVAEGAEKRREYTEKLVERILESIKKHEGDRILLSVILTGSLGRDEATFAACGDSWTLKSDVEIALVYRRISDGRRLRRLIREVAAEFPEDLNLMAVSGRRLRRACNFNYTIRSPRYKTVFTYDLFYGSRTVWGQDFLKEKPFDLRDVDPYEAKRLTANRIGELVCRGEDAPEAEKAFLKSQWKGKLVLAVGSAWLLCEGGYVSSYRGQRDALRRAEGRLKRRLGTDFLEEYEKAFCFLRESGDLWETDEERLREFVRRIDGLFKEKRLFRSRANSLSRNVKYGVKYWRAGLGYWRNGTEDGILQGLIDGYGKQEDGLKETADIWNKVLY